MFNLFKKKNPVVEIKAPLTGRTIPIEEVPDPVFSTKMMGEGIAIKPSSHQVAAPFDGKIVMVMPHAVGIVNHEGLEILIHIGMETVNLEGDGFSPLVKIDDEVTLGTPLIEFDLAFLKAKEINPLTMIVVTNPNDFMPNEFFVNKDVVSSIDCIMTYK